MTTEQAYENYKNVLYDGLMKVNSFLNSEKSENKTLYSREKADAKNDSYEFLKANPSGESETLNSLVNMSEKQRNDDTLKMFINIVNEYTEISQKAALKNDKSLAKAAFATAKLKIKQLKTKMQELNSHAKNDLQKTINNNRIRSIYSGAVRKNAFVSAKSAYLQDNLDFTIDKRNKLVATAPRYNKNNSVKLPKKERRWF